MRQNEGMEMNRDIRSVSTVCSTAGPIPLFHGGVVAQAKCADRPFFARKSLPARISPVALYQNRFVECPRVGVDVFLGYGAETVLDRLFECRQGEDIRRLHQTTQHSGIGDGNAHLLLGYL